MNILDAEIDPGGNLTVGCVRVERRPAAPHGAVRLGIRPEDMELGPPDMAEALTGKVDFVEELGDARIVHVRLDAGAVLSVRHHPEATPRTGELVGVRIDSERAHLFNDAGRRIG